MGARKMRSEFSKKTKVEAFVRAQGSCDKCGARLVPGKFHYDHRIPDAMGGKPTIENCDVLCATCHSLKTATVDAPRIAKTKRQHAAHIGAKAPSRNPLPGSKASGWKKKMSGEWVKR